MGSQPVPLMTRAGRHGSSLDALIDLVAALDRVERAVQVGRHFSHKYIPKTSVTAIESAPYNCKIPTADSFLLSSFCILPRAHTQRTAAWFVKKRREGGAHPHVRCWPSGLR